MTPQSEIAWMHFIAFEHERCCDEEVVAGLALQPARYARSLVSVLELKRQLRWLSAAPGARPFEITQRRLEHIMLRGDRFRSRMPNSYWLALFVVALVLVPGAGLPDSSKTVEGLPRERQSSQRPEPEARKETTRLNHAAPADDKLNPAEVEMHVVGVCMPKNGAGKDSGRVDVEVRPTAKPVVLVLTAYSSVAWHIKLAGGARIKKAIVSGYFEQEVKGLPANVPIVNRSYFPADGSRRNQGWFWASEWNTPQWREMVRRLNDMTGLPLASFQSNSEGEAFIVDGTLGREQGQTGVMAGPTTPKEMTLQDLLAASADAELHVAGIYFPDRNIRGKPVEVEVRSTPKPVVLVLTSYSEAVWHVKSDPGARIKAVLVGSRSPQEVDGLPANVPVYRFCPDATAYFFDRRGPASDKETFFAYQWNTIEYRRMVETLNRMTRQPISTFQGEYTGTSFVVDGTRGRELAQKERNVNGTRGRDNAKNQPKPEENPLADVADIPSQELQAADDASKRYLLIGPKKDVKQPAEGYGLLVIMPGGNGSADFHPFVKRIYKNALSDRYLAAQPIAVQWARNQEIVWPTKTNPVAKMKFGTEEFVDAVIEDVAKRHNVDRTRVFSLSWSSSGPAAYAASLQKKRSVVGSFIAMSVFNPKFLPALTEAKGQAYYLYHSQQDRVCPFRMAEQAKNNLSENGAKVHLETYEGGHGWRGSVFRDIRNGVEWLEKNREKASGSTGGK
jgi:predicted esterase